MATRTRKKSASRTNFSPDQLPLFRPKMDWEAPTEWKDLSQAKVVGFDTETKDPNLKDQGPGFIRGDACVVGVSLATEDGYKIYLPFGHAEGNVDPDQAKRYIKEQLSRADQVKVGANVMYDLEALWSLGIDVTGTVRDIQVAEPLLDEESETGYSLSALSMKYLGLDKTEDVLNQAGIDFGFNPKENMDALPAGYVGKYAEDDALLPIQILMKQYKQIEDEDLRYIFDLETDLTQVLFKMRLGGVRVDLDKAEKLITDFKQREQVILKKIRDEAGRYINPFSSKEVGRWLTTCGLQVPSTRTGSYSITSDWLQSQNHPFARLILESKQIHNMWSQFIQGFMINKSINGRLHTNWHQLRDIDDSGGSRGTRSGRIASSKPNLTQVPSRHPEYGKAIRSLFVTDEGKRWIKADYSQQEPRITLEFACRLGLPGADEARQRYIQDPSTDYHQLIADLVVEKSGKDIGRRAAKDINLGGAYGMGKPKLRSKLGLSVEEADEIFAAYHIGAPYIKPLSKIAMDRAQRSGYIKTLLGRRRRFSYWERRKFIDGEWQGSSIPTRDYEKACEKWGKANVIRAYIHKALNAAVQGSAADQMKKAIVNLDKAGLTPSIQVYDEINGSYDGPEEAREVARLMEESIPLSVPFKVDPEIGDNWGEVEEL